MKTYTYNLPFNNIDDLKLSITLLEPLFVLKMELLKRELDSYGITYSSLYGGGVAVDMKSVPSILSKDDLSKILSGNPKINDQIDFIMSHIGITKTEQNINPVASK